MENTIKELSKEIDTLTKLKHTSLSEFENKVKNLFLQYFSDGLELFKQCVTREHNEQYKYNYVKVSFERLKEIKLNLNSAEDTVF